MLMSSLEMRARLHAYRMHSFVNQVRKYTGQPYIVHPEEVANTVRSVPHTEEMLAAAWLHDVVEDTHANREEGISQVWDMFGATVAIYVGGLTDISKPEDGNRATRKDMDLQHTAEQCPEVKTIKLADLLSNTKDILVNDVDFARVYFKEKRNLLQVLKDGDMILWAKANWYVETYFKWQAEPYGPEKNKLWFILTGQKITDREV